MLLFELFHLKHDFSSILEIKTLLVKIQFLFIQIPPLHWWELWVSEGVVALVRVLEGVTHDCHQSQPSLLCGGNNLLSRQQETVEAGVSQLKGVWVLDALLIGPVNSISTCLV